MVVNLARRTLQLSHAEKWAATLEWEPVKAEKLELLVVRC